MLQKKIRVDLLEYCKLDTFAMYKILEVLRKKFRMDFSQMLFIFLCFILIWLVIKFVTKFFYKILLLISIILIFIYSFFNFTENNIFDTMQELYCEEESKVDNLKCTCFVNNIISDFKIRNNDLSDKELEELKNNTSKSFHEFIKSYNSTKYYSELF